MKRGVKRSRRVMSRRSCRGMKSRRRQRKRVRRKRRRRGLRRKRRRMGRTKSRSQWKMSWRKRSIGKGEEKGESKEHDAEK